MNASALIRLLAFATICALGGTPIEARRLPDDVMPLSEVKAGMKGEAYSVVHGFKLERYEVEILGIENGGLPGSAMILGVVAGPGIGQHGIVAGMSGSPVYIDGKIIGALSYGFQFAYRPIAGITPIESMLPLLDALDEAPLTAVASTALPERNAQAFGWDWRAEWEAYSGFESIAKAPEPVDFRATSSELMSELGSEPLRMIPLVSPFYVSGLSGPGNSELKAFFAARGLSLMPMGSSAGSSSTPDEPSPPMVAGSALAIPIMTGDLSISAVGTATYRSGDKILGFGHPGFSRGRMNAPMSQAMIIGYMQSYALSFKLAESREIVGSVRQDNRFGVGGVFGEAPPQIEVSVKVDGAAANPARTYHYSIWQDRDFAPMFSMVAIMESIGAATAPAGEVTGECTYRIRLSDGREIVKTDRTSSQGGLGMIFGRALQQDMFLLMRNPFEQADVVSIDVDVKVDEGYRFADLIAAEPRYEQLMPGDPLVLDTRWRPYRGSEYSRTLTVALPEDLKAGLYVVHLADAETAQQIDQVHNRGRYRVRDLQEIIDVVNSLEYPEDRISVFVFEPKVGMSIQGESIESVPGSIERLMARSAPEDLADTVIGRKIQVDSFNSDIPVRGQASFVIEVSPYLPR